MNVEELHIDDEIGAVGRILSDNEKKKGILKIDMKVYAMKAPNIMNSPWAKLMISVALKMRTNPRATNP